MTKAQEFFYMNAGFSYDPKRQTVEQGREECAIALAHAEATAKERGWFVEWIPEECPDLSWMEPEELAEEHEVECALLKAPCSCCKAPRVVAALGNIVDASPNYRRVAVRLQRMAGRAAVERPVSDWLALQRAADLAALEASRSILDMTGAVAVRPADVARGN